MNRTKIEYTIIIIVTILHGIITDGMLNGLPLVSLKALYQTNVVGICLWTIYGAVLYMMVQMCKCQNDKILISCVQAVRFGILTALAKGCFDELGARLMENYLELNVMQVACGYEIGTLIFGMAIMLFLFFVIAKRKFHYDWKKARLPLCIMVLVIAAYTCAVISCFIQNKEAIAMYDANNEETQNLAFYFAYKILDLNAWLYVRVYILFWWFLNTITIEKQN